MKMNHNETDVMEEIQVLQADMPELCYHDSYQSISTGPIIPGCAICTRMAHYVIQLGFRCNAKCPFCFLDVHRPDQLDADIKDSWKIYLDEVKRNKDKLEGISLSGGEPLLYLPQMKECVAAMREIKPDLHFWVYTNGILADDEHLQNLAELGITELRFDLAATDYNANTIKNLELAKKYMEYVAVEVPSYPKQKDKLIGCLDELDRIGIAQLNLQELLITTANMSWLEGEGYESGLFSNKKHFLYGSRKMTYEVMKYCLEKGYSFTVNDCSVRKFGKRQ